MAREKNTSRPPKLPDINKKSDVSRCSKKAVKMVQCAQRTQTNGQRSHRGSCGRKKTPTKTVKETHPPRPPTKLPDIKLPTRPKINWPIAPDGFIPNSIVRSLAPFPPRSGAVPRVKEEKEDGLAQSAIYVERLIQKYENTAEEEKKLRKNVPQR